MPIDPIMHLVMLAQLCRFVCVVFCVCAASMLVTAIAAVVVRFAVNRFYRLVGSLVLRKSL